MAPSRSRLAVACVVAAAVSSVFPSASVPAAPQQPAGMLARWADLETWSRYDERTNETEVGLGLQPHGPSGPMLLSFTAEFPGKIAVAAPEAIFAQPAVSPTINPNLIRTPTLVFLIDVKMPRPTTLDVSQRMTVDSPGPGTIVTTGRAALSPEEFRRVAGATTLHAKILGVDVEFRRDQLRAMREFAERLRIRSGRGAPGL
jgi:hypothetical protein